MSSWEASGQADEWFTPKYIFDALDCTFDMDVANGSPDLGYVPCRHTIAAESLSLPWHGFVWMNPPYGGKNGVVPWLEKFFEHGNGIALVPDRTSAPWFQEFAPKADSVLFVSPKIKFERVDGSLGKQPGCGTALFAVGVKAKFALLHGRKLGWLCVSQKVSGVDDDD